MSRRHAVILVPGGGGNSPFTTPDEGCRTGLAAGGQLTALRAALLEAGLAVFTCPARIGGGVIDVDPGWGAFADGPAPRPAAETIDSKAPLSEAGENLTRFVTAMAHEHDFTDVHFVGYSMGGLSARDAAQRLMASGPRVRTLTSIGTPWLGSFVTGRDPATLPLPRVIAEYVSVFIGDVRSGIMGSEAPAVVRPRMTRQYAGALDGITLCRIAATVFPTAMTTDGEEIEANDGHVTRSSALGIADGPDALPAAECFELPDLHSNYLADLLEEPWESAVNWDPRACEIVVDTVLTSIGSVSGD
jgi:triacylglycerol lipase